MSPESPTKAIDPFVRLALACIRREYPNQVALRLDGDTDLRLPRELTPAFYGCYDWHSAVHAHWLLARAVHHGSDLADTRRASRLAPGPGTEIVRSQLPYSISVDGRPFLRRLLGGIAQPFRNRQHRRQFETGINPLVIVLPAGFDPTPGQLEVSNPGDERQVEQLSQLWRNLAGVRVHAKAVRRRAAGDQASIFPFKQDGRGV